MVPGTLSSMAGPSGLLRTPSLHAPPACHPRPPAPCKGQHLLLGDQLVHHVAPKLVANVVRNDAAALALGPRVGALLQPRAQLSPLGGRGPALPRRGSAVPVLQGPRPGVCARGALADSRGGLRPAPLRAGLSPGAARLVQGRLRGARGLALALGGIQGAVGSSPGVRVLLAAQMGSGQSGHT